MQAKDFRTIVILNMKLNILSPHHRALFTYKRVCQSDCNTLSLMKHAAVIFFVLCNV